MDERVFDLQNQSVSAPISVNTWGDAFYMIFNSVAEAGRFALRMQEVLVPPPVGRADWKKVGLPDDLSIRIALHAGPVYSAVDPVTRELSFYGSHVILAARLEPVTARGEVYCTEGFAAMAFVDGVRDFRCEFMGRRALAKSFGEMAVFRVCRIGRNGDFS
jgi:class 3 adenylate cyclase